LANVNNELGVHFENVKVSGAASFSDIANLGNMTLRKSVFENELQVNPGATAENVELTDVTLAQADVNLPAVNSVRLKGVRVKKRLRLGLKRRASKRSRGRSLNEKSTGKDVDVANVAYSLTGESSSKDVDISDISYDGQDSGKGILAVQLEPTSDAKDLSVSISNINNMALQLNVTDVAGVSHLSVQNIVGSRSQISSITVKESSLKSLNVSKVKFTSGGSVSVLDSKILGHLEMTDMAKLTSFAVKDSTSARVRIKALESVAGDLTIERHELAGSKRAFEIDLNDAVIGGNVVVADINGA